MLSKLQEFAKVMSQANEISGLQAATRFCNDLRKQTQQIPTPDGGAHGWVSALRSAIARLEDIVQTTGLAQVKAFLNKDNMTKALALLNELLLAPGSSLFLTQDLLTNMVALRKAATTPPEDMATLVKNVGSFMTVARIDLPLLQELLPSDHSIVTNYLDTVSDILKVEMDSTGSTLKDLERLATKYRPYCTHFKVSKSFLCLFSLSFVTGGVSQARVESEPCLFLGCGCSFCEPCLEVQELLVSSGQRRFEVKRKQPGHCFPGKFTLVELP